MSGSLIVEPTGDSVWLTLNRPHRLNAIDKELAHDLLRALLDVREDSAVRAVGIRGAGDSFSSGADLTEADDPPPSGAPEDAGSVLRTRYNPLVSCIREMEQPVLAAVKGSAAGVGFSIALACDQIVAAESASFLLPFVRIGLAPDGGALPMLAMRVGMTRAVEMALLATATTGRQAAEIGLVNACVPDAEFEQAAIERLEQLARSPRGVVAAIKRETNEWCLEGLGETLELEASTQRQLADSSDFREGVAAFREKRRPQFG